AVHSLRLPDLSSLIARLTARRCDRRAQWNFDPFLVVVKVTLRLTSWVPTPSVTGTVPLRFDASIPFTLKMNVFRFFPFLTIREPPWVAGGGGVWSSMLVGRSAIAWKTEPSVSLTRDFLPFAVRCPLGTRMVSGSLPAGWKRSNTSWVPSSTGGTAPAVITAVNVRSSSAAVGSVPALTCPFTDVSAGPFGRDARSTAGDSVQLSLGPLCRAATKLMKSAPERVTWPALFRGAPVKRYAVPATALACMAVVKVVSRLPASPGTPGAV